MDTQEQDVTSQGTALAVVHTTSARLVGSVPRGAKPGDVVTVRDCFELRFAAVPMQGPNGIGIIPQILQVLVDMAIDFVDVETTIGSIRWFSDLDPEEQKKLGAARGSLEQQIRTARAQRAGLSLPGGGFGGPRPA